MEMVWPGHRQGMEVFEDVWFARLRSEVYGSYLHAEEDGRSVYHGSLGGGGASQHNAVWAVQELVVAGESPMRYLLLRGAYGRYLGAPDAAPGEAARNAAARDAAYTTDAREEGACEGCCACCFPLPCRTVEATQRDRDEVEVDAIMWRATGCPRGDFDIPVSRRLVHAIVLLHDRSGRYLRGNESFLACRRSVSVDANAEDEDTLRWEVVRVPPSEGQGRPELPIATQSGGLIKILVTACFPPLRRDIQFLMAAAGDDVDNIGEGRAWITLKNEGRSVQLLREKLAGLVGVGYNDFTMCVRAGRHGRLTPLLIDLPRSRETLHVVLVRPNTAVNDQLIFPNLNALPSAEATDEEDAMIE